MPKSQSEYPHLERVLCYGASTTEGVSPPYEERFPYAPVLQQTLGDEVVVRHRGLPGWTATAMLDYANDEQRGLLVPRARPQGLPR